MTPKQISAHLRQIAAKIDNSKRPSAALVAKDVSALIRKIAINEGGQGDSVFMRLDELLGDLEKDPQVKKLVEELKKTIEGAKEPEQKVASRRTSSIASRVASRWLTAGVSFDWSGLTRTIDKAAEGDEASKKKVHEYFDDTCVKENTLKPQDVKDISAAFDKLVESKNDQQQQVEFSKLLKPMFKQHFKL